MEATIKILIIVLLIILSKKTQVKHNLHALVEFGTKIKPFTGLAFGFICFITFLLAFGRKNLLRNNFSNFSPAPALKKELL